MKLQVSGHVYWGGGVPELEGGGTLIPGFHDKGILLFGGGGGGCFRGSPILTLAGRSATNMRHVPT